MMFKKRCDCGRPPKMTLEKIHQAQRMRAEVASLDHIAAVLSVGKTTVARARSSGDAVARGYVGLQRDVCAPLPQKVCGVGERPWVT
jgi:hypothetical protein